MAARTEIEVRVYAPEDCEALRLLALEMHRSSTANGTKVQEAAFDEYFDHLLKIHGELKGAVLVAGADGELVGFVCVLGIAAPQGDAADSYSFLSDLYVRPTHRGCGIGRRLAAGAERCARQFGASTIALRVAADNAAGLAFYRAHRYREQFVVMSKEL